MSELAAHVVTDRSGLKDKYALVNKAGETVVTFGIYNNTDFSSLENHNGTAFVAELDGSIGLIDDKGKEIVPFGYYNHIFQPCYIALPEGYILPHEIGKNTYIVYKKDEAVGLINDKQNLRKID